MNQASLALETPGFDWVVSQTIVAEHARAVRHEVSAQTVRMFEMRCEKHLLPFFGGMAIDAIQYPQLMRFVDELSRQQLHNATIRQLLIAVRKVLNWALVHEHITGLPAFPKVRSESTPRGGFTPCELLKLWHFAKQQSTLVRPEGGYTPIASRSSRRAFCQRHAHTRVVSLDDCLHGEQLCTPHRSAQHSTSACAGGARPAHLPAPGVARK